MSEEETDADKEPSVRSAESSEAAEVGPLRSRGADWLDVNGGFVLLAVGAGLIVLACFFASSPAVAPIFAAFGAVLILCSAFYSRIEGSLSASGEGVRFGVRAAQRGSRERDYPIEIEYEAIARTVEEISQSHARSRPEAEAVAAQVLSSLEREVQETHRELIRRFGQSLVRDGAFDSIREEAGRRYDLLAESDDEVLLAEAKAGRAVGLEAIHQLVAAPPPADLGERRLRRALVVPSDLRVTMEALDRARVSNVEVHEVWTDGRVERVL